MTEQAVVSRPAARKTRTALPEVGALEGAVIQGDLTPLTEEERLDYYRRVCASLGLNPLTQPFGYIIFNKQLKLYPKKDCTDQLRTLRGVSVTLTRSEQVGDFYIVHARATLPDGRTDEDCGVVALANLKGADLANAYMRCTTKAKRRVTLSVCGLGWLDETEIETVEGAHTVSEASVAAAPAPVEVRLRDADVKQLATLCRDVATRTSDTATWQEIARQHGLQAEDGNPLAPAEWRRLTPEVFRRTRDELLRRKVALEAEDSTGEAASGAGA